jgi:hypothetical protein
MNLLLKRLAKRGLQSAVQNPKKFFAWAMVLLSVSLIASLVQGIFFPSETVFKIRPPIVFSKSRKSDNIPARDDTEMQKIVSEMKVLKTKRDESNLDKKDSLRIDYLFDQYQKLKNGH